MNWRKAFAVLALLLFGMTFFLDGMDDEGTIVLAFCATASVLGGLGAGIVALATRGLRTLTQLNLGDVQ